ncbi:MAG: hypothetical protein WAV76_06560 [Bacteroidota bacterium]
MKKAAILANGKPLSRRVLNLSIKSSDLFICADGGANADAALNVTPHVIIGDRGIPTTDLRWNLKNEILRFGLREGPGNVVETNPNTIRHRRGDLMIFVACEW